MSPIPWVEIATSYHHCCRAFLDVFIMQNRKDARLVLSTFLWPQSGSAWIFVSSENRIVFQFWTLQLRYCSQTSRRWIFLEGRCGFLIVVGRCLFHVLWRFWLCYYTRQIVPLVQVLFSSFVHVILVDSMLSTVISSCWSVLDSTLVG